MPRYRVLHKFDKSILKRNWSKINESPLKRAGLLARTIERGLIRVDTSVKQNPSKPGRPPKSRHPGHPFRRIFSDVNAFETNVVIGHLGFYAGQTAMEIQEFGQRVRIKRRLPMKVRKKIVDPKRRAAVRQMFLSGKLKSKIIPSVYETIKMPERPFAYPTTQRIASRLPALWANCISPATVRN
jgi:hypothetical protein